jgi:peptidyl-prolyl cis-trans isomerase D
VIITFIFWGVGSVDKSTSVSVAEIGNEKISVEEYWRTYENVRARYRDTYKEKFNEEMEKSLNLKEMVLNSLIDERILLLSAKEWKISVTNKELQDAITNDSRFMRDGVFRKDIYFRTLELNRMTPEMFEVSLRHDLTRMKMYRLIGSVVDVTPADVKQIPSDEKMRALWRRSLLMNEQNAALQSYITSIKNRMTIKINKDIIG